MHVTDEKIETQKNYMTWSNHRKSLKIISSDSNSMLFIISQNSLPNGPIYISSSISNFFQ